MYKDEIKVKIPLVNEITDPTIIKLFKDTNLMFILELLRNNRALTEKDIEKEFVRIGNKKNTKTIYGYLKALENANLILQAGKREFSVIGSRKKPKAETLYMRSAKIFFPVIKPESDIEECDERKRTQEEMIKILDMLIQENYRLKLKSSECLSEFITKLNTKQVLTAREMIKAAPEDIADAIGNLEWTYIESMMKIIGELLVLLDEDQDFPGQLLSCFEEI